MLLLGKIRIRVTPEVNAIGAGLMLITLLTFLIAGLITLLRPDGRRAACSAWALRRRPS